MIDSTHVVYPNMQGHTGGITTFGTGIIDQKSAKQKMNSRSSTETKHIGTSEHLPKALFIELFMKAQGYEPKMDLAKDNVSEIRMLVIRAHQIQSILRSNIFGVLTESKMETLK